MARQPSLLFLLLALFLIFTVLFNPIQARPLSVSNHHHHHHHHHHHAEMKSNPSHGGKSHQHNHEAVLLALRGIKNTGPSPGEGHSFVNGAHP
ncbi:precursor of CEP11 [Cornus florida]|uniref:precursor of CEP11 n=1 Tax=Cornus florida TaxID=4283 RepID=UPI0028A008E5|nr:precursor of CEP11 [Cornus florida]